MEKLKAMLSQQLLPPKVSLFVITVLTDQIQNKWEVKIQPNSIVMVPSKYYNPNRTGFSMHVAMHCEQPLVSSGSSAHLQSN